MNSEAAPHIDPWITEKELSARLRVSARHLVNLRKAGLTYHQLGASVRYDWAEVEVYLKTNRRLSAHINRQKVRAHYEARTP
jgi:hypothetical protein